MLSLLTYDNHVAIAGDGLERWCFRADFTPVTACALHGEVFEGHLTLVGVLLVNTNARPDIISHRPLIARNVSEIVRESCSADL